jgi:hypothetical protein
MSTRVSRWYRTGVDGWVAALLLLGPAVCVASAVAQHLDGDTRGSLIAGGATLALLAVYFGLILPMRYGIDDQHVIVRHGLMRERIPLTEIARVEPTRTRVAAPALSLDRLEIVYGDDVFHAAVISPADREAFLAELADKAALRRDRDRLVRPVPEPGRMNLASLTPRPG